MTVNAIPSQPLLTFSQWRYLLLDNGLGAAFLNLGINAAIAWAVFRHVAIVPLWGAVGIATDTVATSLILPIITCVVVTALTRWHVRAGRLPALGPGAQQNFFVRVLPQAVGRRALFSAVVSCVLLAPVTLAMLTWMKVDQLPFADFIVFKAGFAIVNGALVTPPLALAALAGTPDKRKAAP
ncbi:MAG TPA: hypothetical protein VFH73_25630 [Polyangia bacterium]|jgi:hypothetical protein|nr:hypothetical protein [Polyangia bacterium]